MLPKPNVRNDCMWFTLKPIVRRPFHILNVLHGMVWVWGMALNATFNNISVISWRLVLLVEETGVSRENHRPVASHWQTLSYYVFTFLFYRVHLAMSRIGTHNVSGDRHCDCTGSCKSNYHTITTTTVPNMSWWYITWRLFIYRLIIKSVLTLRLNSLDLQMCQHQLGLYSFWTYLWNVTR